MDEVRKIKRRSRGAGTTCCVTIPRKYVEAAEKYAEKPEHRHRSLSQVITATFCDVLEEEGFYAENEKEVED